MEVNIKLFWTIYYSLINVIIKSECAIKYARLHGVTKSEYLIKYARLNGIKIIKLKLVQCDPKDFIGLPK